MSDWLKVHVFLGAPPPPPAGLEEEALAGKEDEERCPAGWRHLELRWTEGRLVAEPGTSGGGGGADSDCPVEGDGCPSSLQEYLDICFPVRPVESAAAAPLSSHTHYLSTWTLSQALVLRGRRTGQSEASPEKSPPTSKQTPPPAPPPPHSSSSSTPELFGSAPSTPATARRAEEGGVVLEDTSDGLLCSQGSSAAGGHASSDPASPQCKRRRRLLEGEKENEEEEEPLTAVGSWGPTTVLTRCSQQGALYTVLVAVVHPCHLKEVKLRSGPAAGSSVPLASIVVTDQSGLELKVALWRRAAFWVLTVCPGDVLLITGLRASEDRWRGETVLQSTFGSKLLNLGRISASDRPLVRQVSTHSLRSLCCFLRERRPLLAVAAAAPPPQDLRRLPYATLRTLRVNTLVHALLRITHTHLGTAWRTEAESRSRSAVQTKAVLTVEQPGVQQGALLLLWGPAVDWLPGFSRDKAAIWDFRCLLVADGGTSGVPELHSTPWSSVRPLEPCSRRAQDFLRPAGSEEGGGGLELDVDTLLSQKYSGIVQLSVQIVTFRFLDPLPSHDAPLQLTMDSSTPLDAIAAVLGGDVAFSGCGRCSAELDTDLNGIYVACYACLPHTSVRRYYRPAVLTVSQQGSRQVMVQVPPGPLQKILQAPPDQLHRSSAPGSEVSHLQVAAQRIQSLLSLPRRSVTLTVRSHFLCDENSVTINQDLTLLDLQVAS